jgi:hypothetical protein
MNLNDRIQAASSAIDAHRDATRDQTSDSTEALTELLTNLRHLCDAEDLDFQSIARKSFNRFNCDHG